MIKLRYSFFSPFWAPGVLDQPAVLSVLDVPSDQLHGVSGGVLVVFGVDLVESFLVEEEVSVDWDHCHDGSVVENFLFDILLI